jgi:hypothetical protein
LASSSSAACGERRIVSAYVPNQAAFIAASLSAVVPGRRLAASASASIRWDRRWLSAWNTSSLLAKLR